MFESAHDIVSQPVQNVLRQFNGICNKFETICNLYKKYLETANKVFLPFTAGESYCVLSAGERGRERWSREDMLRGFANAADQSDEMANSGHMQKKPKQVAKGFWNLVSLHIKQPNWKNQDP